MTSTATAPTRPPHAPAAPPERRPTWARWRPALRLAARDARGTWRRSALIVALVGLPVALVVGAAVVGPVLAARDWAAEQALGGGWGGVDPGPWMLRGSAVLAVVLGFLQVVLLAGAAFTVTAKRRQRELALLAAAGAEPGDLARAVMAQALLLGGIGAVLGSALPGLVAALAAAVLAGRVGSPLVIVLPDPGALLLVPILGVLACVLASLPAARQVTAIPLAETLRCREGAPRPAPSLRARSGAGLGWALPGAVLTACGVAAIARYVGTPADVTEPSLLLVGTGIVLCQVGLLLCSPALLRLVIRTPRLPVATRLAARDVARNGLRSAFAVAAVAAAVGLASAALVWTGSMVSTARATSVPALAGDAMLVQPALAVEASGGEADAGLRAAAVLDEADRVALAAAHPGASVALVGLASTFEAGAAPGVVLAPRCDVAALGVAPRMLVQDPVRMGGIAAQLPADSPCLAPAAAGSFLAPMATVGSPGESRPGVIVASADAAALLLGRDDPRVRAALSEGSAVALSPRAAAEGTVRLAQTAQWLPEPTTLPVAELPAVVVADLPVRPGAVLVAPEALAAAGLRAELDAAVVRGARDGRPPAGFTVAWREHGAPGLLDIPGSPFASLALPRDARGLVGVWTALLFALLATVLVTGLALAEARGELAVMAAVGATPRIRRRFAAASAAILGLVGSLLGTLAGIPISWAALSALPWVTDPDRCLLLPVGTMPGGWSSCSVPLAVPLAVPWAWLLVLVLAVPAAAASVQYVLTPTRQQLARR
ncbi:MAG TPA: FtsX-like permease family protein [Candidatus Nanopelagicales bacterium]